MNWLATSLGLSLAAALFVQGVICIAVAERQTKTGILGLLLAAISAFACLALESGAVVVSSEFGVAMVQGGGTAFLLGTTLVAIAISGGLCWLSTLASARQPAGWKASTAILSIGAAAGLAAALQLSVVQSNSQIPAMISVHFYGMWYPPLLLWLLVCLSQSVLALTGARGWVNGALLAILMTVPVAVYGLAWQEIGDPFTAQPFARHVWLLLVWLLYPAPAALLAWRLLPAGRRRLVGAALVMAAGFLLLPMVWTASGCSASRSCSFDDVREPLLGVFVLIALAHAAMAVRAQRAAWRSYIPSRDEVSALAYVYWQCGGCRPGSDAENWDRAQQDLRERGPAGRWEPYILSGLLCLVALALFDLLFFWLVFPGIDLLLAFAAWSLFAEFVAKGAFARIPGWTFELARACIQACLPLVSRKKAGPPQEMPAEKEKTAGTWGTMVRATLAVLAGVILLVMFVEALHYGRTIVEPFTDPETDTKKERPGDQLSKLIVDELGRLRRDFPELGTPSGQSGGGSANPGGGENRRPTSHLALASDGSSFSAIAGDNNVDLFGLKIPLGTLASVVQAPVRYVFRVEDITGSIYEETDSNETKWRAVAVSNQGKIWSTGLRSLTRPVSLPDFGGCDVSGAPARSAIQTLAHELAFRITGDRPDFGMTRNATAFEYFDRGIHHLSQFDRAGKRAELRGAIDCFVAATSIDHGFSDAYDRLAVALEHNRQPIRAIEALRAIAHDKPNYVRALLRRADADYNLATFYDQLPPVVPPMSQPDTNKEAVHLWYQVAAEEPAATVLERRAAYAGLCQAYWDDEIADAGTRYFMAAARYSPASPDPDKRAAQLSHAAEDTLAGLPHTNFFLPYFFCKRAEALYTAIPWSDRSDPDLPSVEATVMNILGNTITAHNQRLLQQKTVLMREPLFERWRRRPFSFYFDNAQHRRGPAQIGGGPTDPDLPDMFCSADNIDRSFLAQDRIGFWAWHNPIGRYSLPYYDAGRRLAPDDPTLACNYASAALYFGEDPGPMRALRGDLNQEIAIGDALSHMAHELAYGLSTDALYIDVSTPERVQASAARNAELALFYYQMAAQFYYAALQANGSSITALNAYGYGIWRWAVDSRRSFAPPPPDVLQYAANSIGKALEYLSAARNPGDLLSLRTTLAELDIAQGWPERALDELTDLKNTLSATYIDAAQRTAALSAPVAFREALQKATSLGDSDLAEMFSDTAHANACASLNPKNSAGQKAAFEQAAGKELQSIQDIEAQSEYRPFTDQKVTIEILKRVCFAPPAQ